MSGHPWPTTIDELLARHDVDPGSSDDGGNGGTLPVDDGVATARWRVGPLTVTRFDGGAPSAEIAAARLAAIGAAVPFAVPTVVGTDGPWLVTERPPGLPADRPEAHPEPGSLAGTIGAGLAALHDLPRNVLTTGSEAGDRPGGPAGWREPLDRCRSRVERGAVDRAALPPPYDRYEPDRLLELLVETIEGLTPAEPVVSHGRASPDAFLVGAGSDPAGLAGLAGLDGLETALPADRHLDLATAHLWVADVLGQEAVFSLYEGYGADPELSRLDAAVLAVQLLGTGPTRQPVGPER